MTVDQITDRRYLQLKQKFRKWVKDARARLRATISIQRDNNSTIAIRELIETHERIAKAFFLVWIFSTDFSKLKTSYKRNYLQR